MRNRILEIAAALIGVAIVVVLYLDRSGGDPAPEPEAPEAASPSVQVPPQPSRVPSSQADAGPMAEPATGPEPLLQEPEEPEVAEARDAWELARVELDAVEVELEKLDQRFDAKEAELTEREAQGIDPEVLEEEMLIFLDGIVDEYDALEARLAEAEAAELAAAERLAKLRGEVPEFGDPGT